MKPDASQAGTLHFVGIGGIGMSGIAEVMHALGYHVQGSDLSENANVKRLSEKGVRVSIGHDPKNIKDKDGNLPAALIISSAVKADNVELLEARDQKVPVMRRAEMLAELMKLKSAIVIAGTHGKTTTTSMVGEMMEIANFDPTIINGGIVNAYGTNTRLGDSDMMVVEADESDGTFTRLPVDVAVVTNMDAEHMDHYGDFESVKRAYREFIQNLPFYGYAVMCIDHPEVQSLISSITDRKVVTYGFSPQADVRASNVRHDKDGSTFDVTYAPHLNGGQEMIIKDVRLPMLGRHNVQNALVPLAIAQQMEVPVALIKKGMEGFSGVKRRFTKAGEVNEITIIDDYAHHPVEIETVLKTARLAVKEAGGNVIAVAQPHRYTRLRDLFDEFCTCFNEADSVLIMDVYEAGESPIEDINAQTLAEGIKAHGHRDATAGHSAETLASQIAQIARPGDFVICMGAGDITATAHALPAQLEAALEKSKTSAA